MPTCVADIMTKELFVVDPGMLLSDLEWEFSRRRFGGAPVVEDGKLVGMVSRADIVRRIGFSHAMSDMAMDYYRQLDGTLEGAKPDNVEQLADQTLGNQLRHLHVHDAMTTHPATTSPSASAQAVAQLMLDKRVHRVVVVQAGQPVGLVTTFDLVRLIAQTTSI